MDFQVNFIPNGEEISLENKLAEEGYEFVIGGLYYDWCVKTHEKNLNSRYPNIKTSRPEYLSRWSGSRAEMEHRNGGRFEIIPPTSLGRRTIKYSLGGMKLLETKISNMKDLEKKYRNIGERND